MAKEYRKKKGMPRQDWKPHWTLGLLYRLWMIAFSVAKIAIGAAATVLLICVVCGFVFVGILGDYLQEDILPAAADTDIEGYDLDLNSYIYYVDSNGNIQPLQQIYAEISSEWADYEDIPEDLVHAAMAIEDHRFLEHQGVDWVTTIKACARMFFGDDSVGGSSITQQLIKNMLLKEDETADDVTVRRKVLEIFRAVQLEKRYDKETIMEMYLNCIYLGQGCRGVRSAAATYFGKELEMLTTAECASLISITNNPSLYDPYGEAFLYKPTGKDEPEVMTGMERNKNRQENVLWAMKEYGWLTDVEYEKAVAQKLVLKNGIDHEDSLAECRNASCGYKNTVSTYREENGLYYCPACGNETLVEKSASKEIYSWYVDTVIEDVAKALAERDGVAWNYSAEILYKQQIQKSGYHIYTCLDMDVQNQIDAIYTNLEEIPYARGGQQLQSAIVVTDNRTGDIVGMSGGVGEKVVFDDWNRATDAKLQSGSSIKPLSIYAPAFEAGAISPATVIKDLPLTYDSGAWPLNAERVFNYSKTVFGGVVSSVNAVAAHTLDIIGTNYSYDFAKNKFGLSTLVDEYVNDAGVVSSDNDFAPLAMGAQTWGVTVRDMTDAYGTFANNGVYREGRTFTKVYDSDGNLVLDNEQESRTILSEKTVNYMNYCLVNAAQSGTGYETNLYWSHGITNAGKTGSTGDNKDRWFCGFTGYYTAAVWCGYDSPAVIYSDGNPSSQLWKKVMGPLHEGKTDISLYDSSAMSWTAVCLDSGGVATEACSADIRGDASLSRVASGIQVYYEDRPTTQCTKHVMVDYCTAGGGVATEYCQHFAEVDESVKIEKKSLVKMTQEEIDEIWKAKDVRLDSRYLRDDYVYLVTDSGADGVWKGFRNDLKQEDAPYVVCSAHTQKAWEAYEKEHVQETEPETKPSKPSTKKPAA